MILMEEVITGDTGSTDVPGGARLVKIMAKQVGNRVSTIKLLDGQFTQAVKGTQKGNS
jgi:hypothetical protein